MLHLRELSSPLAKLAQRFVRMLLLRPLNPRPLDPQYRTSRGKSLWREFLELFHEGDASTLCQNRPKVIVNIVLQRGGVLCHIGTISPLICFSTRIITSTFAEGVEGRATSFETMNRHSLPKPRSLSRTNMLDTS